MGAVYTELLDKIRELHALRSVEGVLEWDQETQMPKKAAAARAEQIALIAGLAHQRLASDEMGDLLSKAEGAGAADDPAHATNIRETRRDHDRAVRIPNELVREYARAASLGKDAWQKARAESNFAAFMPALQRLLDIRIRYAEHYGWKSEPYDALMDEFEPGATAAEVAAVFSGMKTELAGLVSRIMQAPKQPNSALLERDFPVEQQAAFNRELAGAINFDFEAGRIDVSTHPFCSGFSPTDVRLTTRYHKNMAAMSMFGTLHEAGHGLYEQGFSPEHTNTPMAQAISLGIHESQSRMWENQVGRSRPFWEFFFPKAKARFQALSDVSLDDWHFAVNAVKPSLIRVEADEVTYGLHIILRFEIERRMLRKEISLKDIPDAWNTSMQELIGITPPNDAQGCLQDIHWAQGIFGYFPTYALGNLYSAQFFNAAQNAMPDMWEQIRNGRMTPLREWLREHIHKHGRRYRAKELVKVVTGEELSPEPFMAYLNEKYGALYGLV
ncbi:MAG: carboxypeptidase M32 [Phycisphaerales bacterium]|nr:carboxypeptidase M32 [Phycisphaerales bacterium]